MGSRMRRLSNLVAYSTVSKFRQGSSPIDDLGLVKTVDRCGKSVVITVADTPDRRLDARLRQPLGITNGHILRAAVGVAKQSATMDGPPIMKRLIKGIENKAGIGSPACPPADDAASESINDKSPVDEALPGRHIGEIRKPQHVRRWRKEMSVHPVEWAWGSLIADLRADRYSASDALQPDYPHKPSDSAPGDVKVLPLQLPQTSLTP